MTTLVLPESSTVSLFLLSPNCISLCNNMMDFNEYIWVPSEVSSSRRLADWPFNYAPSIQQSRLRILGTTRRRLCYWLIDRLKFYVFQGYQRSSRSALSLLLYIILHHGKIQWRRPKMWLVSLVSRKPPTPHFDHTVDYSSGREGLVPFPRCYHQRQAASMPRFQKNVEDIPMSKLLQLFC